MFYRKFGKRLVDMLVSGMGLLLLGPFILGLAVLVRFKLGSPIIFSQKRPGYRGRVFTLYKFRTMTDEKDSSGRLLDDQIRLTRFGSMLRATSLDELPELWNIFIGDMSLVGPRPLLVKYLPLYTEQENKRHMVRPGLTGLAQIKGRNSVMWEQRFAYDGEYVDNISLINDLRIMMGTVKKVLKKEDVVSPGVMEDFDVYRTKQLQSANADTTIK